MGIRENRNTPDPLIRLDTSPIPLSEKQTHYFGIYRGDEGLISEPGTVSISTL